MALYRVAVCEDETLIRREQETVSRAVLEKLDIEYHLSAFESGAALWGAFSRGERYDLFLLDIVMDETDGMELARRIRRRDKDAAIVFITSNPDYALKGYDVNALHYLMKPLDAGALERLIGSDVQSRFHPQFLTVRSGTQSLRIPVRDILYLENTGRRVVIALRDGLAEYAGKLSELLAHLPGDKILRVHVGYAVNMRHIRELTRTEAVAVNGKRIPVSRAYSKAAQEAFLKQMWE
ncbi:MAG: LytTR family DNA-binding domain-containing protein [Oscillospiraceae bacterium]|nr:LytTR family DNA-binding domain-containing protein [Oscillospiraceae bacterium]